MAVTKTQSKEAARPAMSSKARELMEQLNADAGKSHVWVRTQMNAPAQRPWFADTGGKVGAGEMASGRVAANQLKTLPHRWRWKDYSTYLNRIAGIASQADVSPIEFADRQSILLTNPGLGGRLQVTNTIRCAISMHFSSSAPLPTSRSWSDGWIAAASLRLDPDDLAAISAAIERTGAGSGPSRPA